MTLPRMIPVVAGVIRNNEGQILLARRKAGLKNGGFWEFPGGKIEAGEAPELSLVREIEEELHIQIEVERVFKVVNHLTAGLSILLICYHCRYLGGEIEAVDHDQVAWVPAERLEQYKLTPGDLAIAASLREGD